METAQGRSEVTSDHPLLEDELHCKRLGKPDIVGMSVMRAVALGALVPKMTADGEQASTPGIRKPRKKSLIGIFLTTPKVPKILEQMRRVLKNNFPRKPRTLFDALED